MAPILRQAAVGACFYGFFRTRGASRKTGPQRFAGRILFARVFAGTTWCLPFLPLLIYLRAALGKSLVESTINHVNRNAAPDVPDHGAVRLKQCRARMSS